MSTSSVEAGYAEGASWPLRSPIDVPDLSPFALIAWDLIEALMPPEVRSAASSLGIYETSSG